MGQSFRDIISKFENKPQITPRERRVIIKQRLRKQGILVFQRYVNGYLVWYAGGREYKTLEEAACAYGIEVPELGVNCLAAN